MYPRGSSEIKYLDAFGDSDWSLLFKRELILKKIPSTAHSVLDCGCGGGHLSRDLLARGFWVCGIDLDIEALQSTRRRCSPHLLRCSVEALPFRSSSFGVVLCSDILEHIDDFAALREIHKVIRDDGWIVANVPAMMKLWSKHDSRIGHLRRYEKTDLHNLFQRTGFCAVEASFWASNLLPIALLMRKRAPQLKYPARCSHALLRKWILWLLRVDMLLHLPFGVSLIAVARRSAKNDKRLEKNEADPFIPVPSVEREIRN